MKIETSELTGGALDWAATYARFITVVNGKAVLAGDLARGAIRGGYSPSTKWEDGGPIIDTMEGFELKVWLRSPLTGKAEAHIHNYDGDAIEFGETPLIAAMRVYVKHKLGTVVDVPDAYGSKESATE